MVAGVKAVLSIIRELTGRSGSAARAAAAREHTKRAEDNDASEIIANPRHHAARMRWSLLTASSSIGALAWRLACASQDG